LSFLGLVATGCHDEKGKVTMRVFITWSGDRSRIVAEALRDWLPGIVQSVQPWISSKDIEKGSRPLEVIQAELDGAHFGIAVLTPENLDEKWIHFESGAIAKTVGNSKTRLWTYLVGGVTYLQVQGPLASFQHTLADREDTRKLLLAINSAADSPISEPVLNDLFQDCWHRLAKQLELARDFNPGEKPERRSTDSMLEEILELVRGIRLSPTEDWLQHWRIVVKGTESQLEKFEAKLAEQFGPIGESNLSDGSRILNFKAPGDSARLISSLSAALGVKIRLAFKELEVQLNSELPSGID